ncbi:hypothetical protein DNTS_013284 [Danionella cerebrum]|uniref:Uncharacterized protein n=1 Tax=Danionella cerebrum TaxID=2873325 RepID=A0A553RQF7_9TELE|nr:hypothetical protein DNTS_013284 [Danionella translucida]
MLCPAGQLAFSRRGWMDEYHSASLLILFLYLLQLVRTGGSWPNVFRPQEDVCPGPQWNAMCRACCEYEQVSCKCPSQGTKVGFAVPCCRNALDECDPCILHQGCSIFDNCKTCSNGTWKAQDDFYIRGSYCSSCRQGWSGGDCLTCGDIIQRSQGHVTLESYPISAKCDWTLQVGRGATMELRFSMMSLESDHSCRYDYVEVRDGDSVKSPVIGRYCGEKIPAPIKSSGNSLHIRFVSDGYNNYDGFFATFQEVSGQASALCVTPEKPANGDLFMLYKEGDSPRSVQYICYKPYKLQGASQRMCLPNATWSGNAPICIKEVAIKDCPTPPQLHNGHSTKVLSSDGRVEYVEYFCNSTYMLSGDSKRTCQKNGIWSGSQPMCVRACREPKVSKLVLQNILKHPPPSRKSPVHKLLSASTQRGIEVGLAEKTLPVFRDLPPSFHHVYSSIEYECVSTLYKPSGSSRRTCLKTGKWSGRHFSCSPACGKFALAGGSNLTEIHWPWHIAIYQHMNNASPLTARTKRRGDTFEVHEEKDLEDEKDWLNKAQRWQLVCSGALVSQHWVLVAARCVAMPGVIEALSADDISVVMGKQDLRDTKRRQHVQVAQILIHPNYDPHILDSDLALLKLADKARISDSVSPVCLPSLQGGEVIAKQAFLSFWHITDHQPEQSHPEAAQTGLIELADVRNCERQYSEHGLPISLTDNMLCGRQHPLSPSFICPSEIGAIVLSPSQITPGPELPPTSGGDDTDSHLSWELIGLASFRYNLQGCNPNSYTIYTRLTNFKNWIEKNIT